MKKISIVTSLYKSSNYVNGFYDRHLAAIKQLNVDYEFVFVDDGSPDDSSEKVMELIKEDDNIKLIVFSRNFGQYPAMFAGMAHARGNLIFTSDSDLEEPPENLVLFFTKMMLETEIDMLYGVTRERKGSMGKRIFGNLFYNVIKWSSDIDIPKNMSWQIMMKQNYVKALLQYNETETLPAGLMMLTGFKQASILIDKTYKGSTSYTMKKKLKLALNSITAFSSKPLVFVGLVGMLITVLSFLGAVLAVISKLFFIDYQAGWISIIISIWLVGGLILSSLGMIGIYLAKVFNQVKNRPLYIIKSINSRKSIG